MQFTALLHSYYSEVSRFQDIHFKLQAMQWTCCGFSGDSRTESLEAIGCYVILVSVLCGNLDNASFNQPQLWLLANKNVFFSNSVIIIDLERSPQNIYLSKQDFLNLVSLLDANNPLAQSDYN